LVLVIDQGIEDHLPSLVDYRYLANLIVLLFVLGSKAVFIMSLKDVHFAVECQILGDPIQINKK